mgnify:CR=1 FL=1
MVKYCCKRCGLKTNIRTHFKRHLNRKHPCKPLESNISIEIIKEEFEKENGTKKDKKGHFMDKKMSTKIYAKSFQCEFCNKSYKTLQTKNRHVHKYCKMKKIKTENDQMKQLLRENEELKEKILNSTSNINNTNIVNNISTINNNNNTIINNNINNNINSSNSITINNYGSENLDYITEQYIQKLLNKNPIQAIRILIKNIHYHPEHPENHNIRITASNRKYNVASVWQDNKWILRDRRTVINDIVDKSYNILDDEYLKTLEDGDSEKTHFNEFQNDYEKKNKSVDKQLKKEAELIIRNGTNSFNNVNTSNK